MRTRSVVPAAVVALALATAGCGGDSAERVQVGAAGGRETILTVSVEPAG